MTTHKYFWATILLLALASPMLGACGAMYGDGAMTKQFSPSVPDTRRDASIDD